jgi:hypothetical protein
MYVKQRDERNEVQTAFHLMSNNARYIHVRDGHKHTVLLYLIASMNQSANMLND